MLSSQPRKVSETGIVSSPFLLSLFNFFVTRDTHAHIHTHACMQAQVHIWGHVCTHTITPSQTHPRVLIVTVSHLATFNHPGGRPW